jgi:hypothetical protein
MAHFFVSYTGNDTAWAEWIAWALEEEGHKVTLQKWDFRPGGNFVVEMQKAAATSDRTIAVLSPDYLKSGFATPEWAAALVQDPTGAKFKLVPVRVRAYDPDGLWKALIYIDLVDLDEETARLRLIEGLNTGRAKPSQAPRFPGSASAAAHAGAPFPGHAEERSSVEPSPPYVPKIRRAPTDLEQRRFVQQGFARIREYFEHAVTEIKKESPDIDGDLTAASATEFSVEIFVAGKSKCRCRIWLGGMFGGNDISYAEGSSIHGNTINDSLSVNTDAGELVFRSMMGQMVGRLSQGADIKRLNAEQAADYLWRRFVAPLEY